jgi:hypothetical protein
MTRLAASRKIRSMGILVRVVPWNPAIETEPPGQTKRMKRDNHDFSNRAAPRLAVNCEPEGRPRLHRRTE